MAEANRISLVTARAACTARQRALGAQRDVVEKIHGKTLQ
jgi:hypothetical protein